MAKWEIMGTCAGCGENGSLWFYPNGNLCDRCFCAIMATAKRYVVINKWFAIEGK